MHHRPTLCYYCTYLDLFQFMAPDSDGERDAAPTSLAAYLHTTDSGAGKRKAMMHEDSVVPDSEPDENDPETMAVDQPMIVSSRTTRAVSYHLIPSLAFYH